MKFKKMMIFLFPEWQIVQAGKKYGPIIFSDKIKQRQARLILKNKPDADRSEKPLQSNKPATPAIIETKQHEINFSNVFDSIRTDIGKLINGQTDYLDQLTESFKWPFVMAFEKDKPKNIIMILGREDAIKKNSLFYMAKLLKEQELSTTEAIAVIDFAQYSFDSGFEHFLLELYTCMNGPEDIVLFENIEKADASMIDVIQTLAETGIYKCNEVRDSIPAGIHSKGQFFVITSHLLEEESNKVLGDKFRDVIGNIIHTVQLSEHELHQQMVVELETLKKSCFEEFSINLSWDKHIEDFIAASIREPNYIAEKVYEPLAQYKSKNEMRENHYVFLTLLQNKLAAQISGETIILEDYLS